MHEVLMLFYKKTQLLCKFGSKGCFTAGQHFVSVLTKTKQLLSAYTSCTNFHCKTLTTRNTLLLISQRESSLNIQVDIVSLKNLNHAE